MRILILIEKSCISFILFSLYVTIKYLKQQQFFVIIKFQIKLINVIYKKFSKINQNYRYNLTCFTLRYYLFCHWKKGNLSIELKQLNRFMKKKRDEKVQFVHLYSDYRYSNKKIFSVYLSQLQKKKNFFSSEYKSQWKIETESIKKRKDDIS